MFSFDIPDNCTHVKLDIGLSFNAPQSQAWLSKETNLMVFGFEPNPELTKPLQQKFTNTRQFQLIPVALSNVAKEEEMNFYINSNDCGTSSLFKHDEQQLGPIKNEVSVPVVSLKMFFDEFPWDRFEYIDYIKIDAQGSDFNILKSAGNYLSEKVVFVTAEPDGFQYFGAHECNTKNITSYMESQNFVRINHPNTNDPTFVNKVFSDKGIHETIHIEQIGQSGTHSILF